MIQNALISYGYQIEPDGQYGQATADAVAQFQGVKGLVVTGTVDALTYAALGPLGVGTDLNGDGVVGPNETIGD
jgi:peptidoglycan hydrolase-like protein with peptidoglycan-binding domain